MANHGLHLTVAYAPPSEPRCYASFHILHDEKAFSVGTKFWIRHPQSIGVRVFSSSNLFTMILMQRVVSFEGSTGIASHYRFRFQIEPDFKPPAWLVFYSHRNPYEIPVSGQIEYEAVLLSAFQMFCFHLEFNNLLEFLASGKFKSFMKLGFPERKRKKLRAIYILLVYIP
jgi:hypothetical protein